MSLLPPRLVTRELLNPPGRGEGGLHCFSPKSGTTSCTEKLRQGLRKLCRREPCRVGGGEHTPACTRAQVHLSGRAHGQGACPWATAQGARNSLAVAGGDARQCLGIKGEFRKGLGKRGLGHGACKYTHGSVRPAPAQRAILPERRTLENRTLWAAPSINPPPRRIRLPT